MCIAPDNAVSRDKTLVSLASSTALLEGLGGSAIQHKVLKRKVLKEQPQHSSIHRKMSNKNSINKRTFASAALGCQLSIVFGCLVKRHVFFDFRHSHDWIEFNAMQKQPISITFIKSFGHSMDFSIQATIDNKFIPLQGISQKDCPIAAQKFENI